MIRTVRYLTHPQVLTDPALDIGNWSLNVEGVARVAALAAAPGVLAGSQRVISSGETKALETARPLAVALAASIHIRAGMHENDRSATGYLPAEAFERAADRFFASPHESMSGWETASAAQVRIVFEIDALLMDPGEGDMLVVGHGAVGTLLWCALAAVPIDRRHDQLIGGGCWFAFEARTRRLLSAWTPMETLSEMPIPRF